MHRFFSVFKYKDLQRKILFSLIMLFFYRMGSHIPISGIDLTSLNNLVSSNSLISFIDLFSGGSLSRFSLFALGILPYINASIIMQLMSFVLPELKSIMEEGESGRKRISQWTRYLTVGLAVIQGLVITVGFKSFVLINFSYPFFFVYSMVGLVAGACLVMYMGELMTENGIGNGASLLIFVGIISQMPFYIKNTVGLVQSGANPLSVLFLVSVLIFIIVAIVVIQEAQRKINVQYAKRIVGRKMYGGQSTFIPLRLIQGGVLPIIFASALLQFPLVISSFIPVDAVQTFFARYYAYDGVLYNGFFCILIFFFTYFYTAISFSPVELSQNIKKYGGFIMGVRPGKPTEQYLESIVTKLTFFGAVFLSIIALLPIIAAASTNVNSFMGLGGTALLIIVGVSLDLLKQIDSFILQKEYEGMVN
ncbi:MAG: preprotein translocase subunit SecY [Candidatus Margulisbacteria bacterium]|nr:preprotein translocase subunit SecY [Candidatus Margulisiibacteriota bacterium]